MPSTVPAPVLPRSAAPSSVIERRLPACRCRSQLPAVFRGGAFRGGASLEYVRTPSVQGGVTQRLRARSILLARYADLRRLLRSASLFPLLARSAFLLPPAPSLMHPPPVPRPCRSPADPLPPPSSLPTVLAATADEPSSALVLLGVPASGPLPVSYTVTLTSAAGKRLPAVTSAAPSLRLLGLEAGTSYAVAAAATLPSGKTVRAVEQPTFSTPGGPYAPVISTASAIDPSSLQLTIEPGFNSLEPELYSIQVTPAAGRSLAASCPGAAALCLVAGLSPNTSYSAAVLKTDSSPASGATFFQTPPSSPSKLAPSISIRSLLALSSTTAKVTFGAPSSGRQPKGYTAFVAPAEGGFAAPRAVTCRPPPASCLLQNLAPGTSYVVGVLSVCRMLRQLRHDVCTAAYVASTSICRSWPLVSFHQSCGPPLSQLACPRRLLQRWHLPSLRILPTQSYRSNRQARPGDQPAILQD